MTAARTPILLPFEFRHIDAPNHRVRTAFYGRVYPVSARTEVTSDPELPPGFRTLPDDFWGTLPFAQATKGRHALPKPKLYGVYNNTLDALEKMHAEGVAFLGKIFTCNVEIRTDWLNDRHLYELMRRKVQEWADALPAFSFKKPHALRLDLHTQPEFVIRTTLDLALRSATESLVRQFVDALDALVDLEQVGLIEWKAPDACRYHHFRHVLIERQQAVRQLTNESAKDTQRGAVVKREHTHVTTVERDLERTHRHARHVHEVLETKSHRLSTWSVSWPKRVDVLLRALPRWLKPIARIITGKEIYRQIIEQDIRTESTTETEQAVETWEEVLYRPDPAVVIGHYVLTGWGEEELKSS